jgi:uncharacterized protein (TIGR02246 family)
MKAIMLAVPLLLLAATAQARDIRSEIDAGNQKWLAAYHRGDAAGVAALYTAKATVLPPGSDIVTGRDGIAKVWGGAIQSGLKIETLQSVSVEQYGNAVREIGRFTAEAPNAQHEMTSVAGKYVVVWKKVKGTWMLDSDIWNLNH